MRAIRSWRQSEAIDILRHGTGGCYASLETVDAYLKSFSSISVPRVRSHRSLVDLAGEAGISRRPLGSTCGPVEPIIHQRQSAGRNAPITRVDTDAENVRIPRVRWVASAGR